MRVTRKFVIAIVMAAAAGFGFAGCATAIPGSPVINSAAAQVVYQQQSEDLLVTTMGLHFHYINGQQFSLVNNSISMHFAANDIPAVANFGSMFIDLGFDPSANVLLFNTTGFSGVQTADSPHYTATWTYSGSVGLDLIVTAKETI